MAVVELIYDVKAPSWVTGNTNVPKLGEPIYLTDGRYTFGDNVTQVKDLVFFGGGGGGATYTAGTGIAISNSNVVSFKSLRISQFINDKEFISKVTTGAVRVALSNKDLDLKSGNFVSNSARVRNLGGGGSQMVVTDDDGNLSTQTIVSAPSKGTFNVTLPSGEFAKSTIVSDVNILTASVIMFSIIPTGRDIDEMEFVNFQITYGNIINATSFECIIADANDAAEGTYTVKYIII